MLAKCPCRWNVPVGEIIVGETSVGEMIVGEMIVGKMNATRILLVYCHVIADHLCFWCALA